MADFQSLLEDFTKESIDVVAGSADPPDKAKETSLKLGLTMKVAHSLDPEQVSELTGAFYDQGKKFLHATGFIIRPDRTLELACYSTGPIGRLLAKDVLSLVRFRKKRAQGSS